MEQADDPATGTRGDAVTSRTAVILQSNYIPWRGYFDLIRLADVFIILDVVQYTKNDWRNRNRIKTRTGPTWLTIPVSYALSDAPAIDEVRVPDPRWSTKHVKSLTQNYTRAGFFDQTAAWLFPALEGNAPENRLSTGPPSKETSTSTPSDRC